MKKIDLIDHHFSNLLLVAQTIIYLLYTISSSSYLSIAFKLTVLLKIFILFLCYCIQSHNIVLDVNEKN